MAPAPTPPMHRLPNDVLSLSILGGSDLSIRLVDKQLRACRDAPLTVLRIDGTKIASIQGHYLRASALLAALTQHMAALTSLTITQLPSFGPLSALPPSLHRLKRLELLDSDRLLSRGDASLAFHLRGISALVSLQELRISASR
jgi:hypothetical protein